MFTSHPSEDAGEDEGEDEDLYIPIQIWRFE